MALSDNLVSYYKLDESSGNASDSVGSNTLTNVGTATYSSAKINNGIDLNGSSQYLNGGNVLNLTTGAWTFSAWIKVTTTGSFEFVGGKSESAGTSDWYMRVTNGNKAEIQFRNGASSNQVVGAVTVADNTWHHVVGLRNGTNVLLYVDGSADGSATDNNYNCSNSLDFHLGADSAGALNFKFNGQIDEVGIWNRALSGTEITELYNAGAGKQYPFGTAYSMAYALGTYTYTGFDIAFRKALNMAFALGTYTYTGFDILFSLGKGIIFETGSYVYTGFDIGLTKALTMVYVLGTYTYTGFNFILTKGMNLFMNTGTYVYTGYNILLRRSGWRNTSKNSTTWTDQSKTSTTWTNIDKSI